MELSPVIAEAVALSVAQEEAPPTVLLRHQRPYVLLGPEDRRLPDLEAGIAFLQERSVPAYERVSGGSAVFLDGHCLSFAVTRPCRDFTMLHRNYRELAAGILQGLALLGLDARFGAAVGSYCEGPYDIVVDGLKIAGVAQAIRRGYALVSGMVLVDQDPVATTDFLNDFYRAAGVEKSYRADVVTSVSALLGRPVTMAEMEQALQEGFAQMFALEAGVISPQERQRAQDLVPQRRLHNSPDSPS